VIFKVAIFGKDSKREKTLFCFYLIFIK